MARGKTEVRNFKKANLRRIFCRLNQKTLQNTQTHSLRNEPSGVRAAHLGRQRFVMQSWRPSVAAHRKMRRYVLQLKRKRKTLARMGPMISRSRDRHALQPLRWRSQTTLPVHSRTKTLLKILHVQQLLQAYP
jgi:hypothetical protein